MDDESWVSYTFVRTMGGAGDGPWTTLASASSHVVPDDSAGLPRFTGAMAVPRADDHDGVGLVGDFDCVGIDYTTS